METEESRIRKYSDVICRYITDETVVVALNAEQIFSDDESDMIKTLHRNGKNQQATSKMLDLLLKSGDERKMGSFRAALRENGHEYLEKIITGSVDPEKNPREVMMIRLFQNQLAHNMRVRDEILTLVFGKGLIEEIDRNEVLQKCEQEGAIRASLLLIDKIQKRKAPKEWYYGFLQSLVESKHESLAYLLEPDFENNPSSFSPEKGQAAGDGKLWDDSVKEFVLTDFGEAYKPSNNLSDQPLPAFSSDDGATASGEDKIVNVYKRRDSDIQNNLDTMNIKLPLGKLSLEEDTSAKDQIPKIRNNISSLDANSAEDLMGFVHGVSSQRIGREKKNAYFKFTIQTGVETYEDVIVYGHELWQEFKDLEINGSSVLLIGLLKRDSIHKEGRFEYQFNEDSRISYQHKKPVFSRKSPTMSLPIPIKNIHQNAKIKNLVNVKGKVIEQTPVRQRKDRLGDLLDYCDVEIEDPSGKINMTLYEEKCSKVQVGKWYIFNNVRVKNYANTDTKKLASVIDTTIYETT